MTAPEMFEKLMRIRRAIRVFEVGDLDELPTEAQDEIVETIEEALRFSHDTLCDAYAIPPDSSLRVLQ